jgi:hypothetical protein
VRRVFSNATGVDALISSTTIPMTYEASSHCAPKDVRPTVSNPESHVERGWTDVTLSGEIKGSATQEEKTDRPRRDKELNEKLDAQTHAFAFQPSADELYNHIASSQRDQFKAVIYVSILLPLLYWAFGRESAKTIVVVLMLLLLILALIEGSYWRETCITLLNFGLLGPVL